MSYHSNVYIHLGGGKVEELQQAWLEANGWQLEGITVNDFTFEADVNHFMIQMDECLAQLVQNTKREWRIWVIRLGENGFSEDFHCLQYHIHKVMDHWAVDGADVKIHPLDFVTKMMSGEGVLR